LILVGQPELRKTLRRPNLLRLTQRVVVHDQLEPLWQAETTK
jgi:type II secretory pathway predicted ATPase ExeA